jgi:hypothetical protein
MKKLLDKFLAAPKRLTPMAKPLSDRVYSIIETLALWVRSGFSGFAI